MRKFAIIALAALALAPSAANAGWNDYTCAMFGINCELSATYSGVWWETDEMSDCDFRPASTRTRRGDCAWVGH